MSANVEAMVREGVNAFKAGRREEARALLLKATELDQYNEQAWLWLSGLMDTPEDQRTCLENVLAINPNNERATQGLSYLTGQTSAGNVSPFSADAPPPAVPPSTSTSVEWAAPDEPPPLPGARIRPAPQEPTPAALDDWVSNLNLPVNDAGLSNTISFGAAASAGSASPFGDFDLNDDDFISGPFGAAPVDVEPEVILPSTPRRSSPPPPPMAAPPLANPPGTRRARLPAAPEESSMLYQLDGDPDRSFQEESEAEMFGYIPREIAATRLPGTHERTPVLLTLGIVVLVLLNLGMAIVVMMGILT